MASETAAKEASRLKYVPSPFSHRVQQLTRSPQDRIRWSSLRPLLSLTANSSRAGHKHLSRNQDTHRQHYRNLRDLAGRPSARQRASFARREESAVRRDPARPSGDGPGAFFSLGPTLRAETNADCRIWARSKPASWGLSITRSTSSKPSRMRACSPSSRAKRACCSSRTSGSSTRVCCWETGCDCARCSRTGCRTRSSSREEVRRFVVSGDGSGS